MSLKIRTGVARGYAGAGWLILFAVLFRIGAVGAQQPAAQAKQTKPQSIIRYESIHHPVIGRNGMVVSQRRLASEAGAEMLAKGGNAVDAAVATGFALAVVLPRAGNIGGGGFMLIHLMDDSPAVAIDYRESAPAAAHSKLFLDESGKVDQQLERFSHRSVGVPGTVAGLTHALSKYGTMKLAEVMQPAIELAEQGFPADYDMLSAMAQRQSLLSRHPDTFATFFSDSGSLPQAGNSFVQPALAATLRQIAKVGPEAFYQGPIADLIVGEMQRHDGLITHADLAAYKPVERKPVRGNYGEYQILSMPPPSSGGVHVVQMLNVISHFPIREMGLNSAASIRVMAEAMKYAYADRSQFLGDPDFVEVPTARLTSLSYAREIADNIADGGVTPSSAIAPGVLLPEESEDTTHFSVVDARGNAVANTYTLNFSFGTGLMVRGAGFLLNNEMADFTAKPGVPDSFGLMGGASNAIAPRKRPVSSMTPTIVLRNGLPFLVTGSPGGSRIISSVFQHLVNVLIHGVNVASAVHQPRFHHQWQPDKLQYEAGMNPDTIAILENLGYQTELSGTMGSIQALMVDDGIYMGVADPRRPGAGAVAVPTDLR